MRFKKVMATGMAMLMALGVFVAPLSGLQTKAAEADWLKELSTSRVYTANYTKSITSVGMQTPETTVKLYAGLSWEALEQNIGVRLNVSDSECGVTAMQGFNSVAASMGAYVVKVLDMDLEKYIATGWSEDIAEVSSPIRVSMALPAGSDLTKDYAVISLKKDGKPEVLGDLDIDPATITVDSAYFDTFAIVAANKGKFDAYKIASPHALDKAWVSSYVKKIGAPLRTSYGASRVYSAGLLGDLDTIKSAIGNQNVMLEISDVEPGPNAKSVMQKAIKQTNAKNSSYLEIKLYGGSRGRVTKTNQKLYLTMTAPYHFPAYADYAVAVLNADGSVTIMKDLDTDDSTVTIATDQFRTYALIWGEKGAFDALP